MISEATREPAISARPYEALMGYKRWATLGLNQVLAENLGRLVEFDRVVIVRLLDHIHTVDEIFSHNLRGSYHGHLAPRSIDLPTFEGLEGRMAKMADWYVDYAAGLTAALHNEVVEFTFSNGHPARMTRGDILLHVAAHGTYHRGAVGILLQKNGVTANDDRMTDYLLAG